MSLLEVNTVDRLDRPSAYYVGKVRLSLGRLQASALTGNALQNKRRRHDDREEREPEPVNKLQGATTLYVGNLYDIPLTEHWMTQPN